MNLLLFCLLAIGSAGAARLQTARVAHKPCDPKTDPGCDN